MQFSVRYGTAVYNGKNTEYRLEVLLGPELDRASSLLAQY